MAKGNNKALKKMYKAHVEQAQEIGTRILTASKVKEHMKVMGMRVSNDFTEALAVEVYRTIWKAVKRTDANDRKTVSKFDL